MRQSILPRIHVSTTCFRGQHPVISQAPPVPQPGAFCLVRYCTDSSPANAHRMSEVSPMLGLVITATITPSAPAVTPLSITFVQTA